MKLVIPYDQSGLLSKIRSLGKVYLEEYSENGILTEALVDVRLQKMCEEFEIKNDI